MSAAVSREITRLRARDGMIYPSIIVDWAKDNPHSELHKHFEWDTDKAAYEYRLSQARRLIAVHVVDPVGYQRETISLVIDRVEGGGYRDLQRVKTTAELRAAAVDQALAELHRWRQRYGFLADELVGIFGHIDRAEARAKLAHADALKAYGDEHPAEAA